PITKSDQLLLPTKHESPVLNQTSSLGWNEGKSPGGKREDICQAPIQQKQSQKSISVPAAHCPSAGSMSSAGTRFTTILLRYLQAYMHQITHSQGVLACSTRNKSRKNSLMAATRVIRQKVKREKKTPKPCLREGVRPRGHLPAHTPHRQ
ncbi:hypothetical protein MC885_012812, partial [Smutsia gigantea]